MLSASLTGYRAASTVFVLSNKQLKSYNLTINHTAAISLVKELH